MGLDALRTGDERHFTDSLETAMAWMCLRPADRGFLIRVHFILRHSLEKGGGVRSAGIPADYISHAAPSSGRHLTTTVTCGAERVMRMEPSTTTPG